MVNGGKVFNLKTLAGKEKLKKKIEELRKFRQGILLQAHKLGLTKAQALGDGQFLKSMVLGLGEINIKRGPLGITRKYAGLLEKFWLKLNTLQDKAFALPGVGRALKFWVHGKTIISKKVEKLVADAVSGILAKVGLAAVTGGTGGLGAVLAPIINRVLKPLLRFAVNRTFKFARDVGAAVLGGDFSGLQKDLSKSFNTTLKYTLYLSSIPVAMGILILFLTSTLASSVTHVTPSRDNAELSGRGEGGAYDITEDATIPSGGSSGSGELDDGATQEDIDKAQEVAKQAETIVNNLKAGFFNYFNWNTDYDGPGDTQDLFNDDLYGLWAYGNRPDLTLFSPELYDHEDSLFWCYWLPVKAFANAGPEEGVQPLGGDPTGKTPVYINQIEDHFTPDKFLHATTSLNVRKMVRPGYVAIIEVVGPSTSNRHVAIVYQIDHDYINTLDANTSRKSFSYTLDDGDDDETGYVQPTALPGKSGGTWTFTITGFGIPY